MSGLLRKTRQFPLDAARIHSPVPFAKSLHVAIIIKTNYIPTIFYVNLTFKFQLMNASAGHFLREKNLFFACCSFFMLYICGIIFNKRKSVLFSLFYHTCMYNIQIMW